MALGFAMKALSLQTDLGEGRPAQARPRPPTNWLVVEELTQGLSGLNRSPGGTVHTWSGVEAGAHVPLQGTWGEFGSLCSCWQHPPFLLSSHLRSGPGSEPRPEDASREVTSPFPGSLCSSSRDPRLGPDPQPCPCLGPSAR